MAINQVFIKLNINSSPAYTSTEATTSNTDATSLGEVMDLLGSLEDVVLNMEATKTG